MIADREMVEKNQRSSYGTHTELFHLNIHGMETGRETVA